MTRSPAPPPRPGRAILTKPPPHWIGRGLVLTAEPPMTAQGLVDMPGAVKEVIAKHRLILSGELPARPLDLEVPPQLLPLLRDPATRAQAIWTAKLATTPMTGNPFNSVAEAAQRKLQKRRAAQWRAHQLARAHGVPSPNDAHDAIVRATAGEGTRRGAITETAAYFRISRQQVQELENIWQKSTKLIADLQAWLDSQ